MRENRFYVRRSQCWGGIYVFAVYDNQTRKRVTNFTNYEKTAERQCKKRNDDQDKFHRKVLSEFATI